MGYRRFTDRAGAAWEVRDRSVSEWELVPVDGHRPPVRVRAPGYDPDPFELSVEELQRLLDEAGGGERPARRNPFGD